MLSNLIIYFFNLTKILIDLLRNFGLTQDFAQNESKFDQILFKIVLLLSEPQKLEN